MNHVYHLDPDHGVIYNRTNDKSYWPPINDADYSDGWLITYIDPPIGWGVRYEFDSPQDIKYYNELDDPQWWYNNDDNYALAEVSEVTGYMYFYEYGESRNLYTSCYFEKHAVTITIFFKARNLEVLGGAQLWWMQRPAFLALEPEYNWKIRFNRETQRLQLYWDNKLIIAFKNPPNGPMINYHYLNGKYALITIDPNEVDDYRNMRPGQYRIYTEFDATRADEPEQSEQSNYEVQRDSLSSGGGPNSAFWLKAAGTDFFIYQDNRSPYYFLLDETGSGPANRFLFRYTPQ
tara:strand:- start:1036 stop:1908 length:873 start_codon:yes stop_codon:yes gene_type:complete